MRSGVDLTSRVVLAVKVIGRNTQAARAATGAHSNPRLRASSQRRRKADKSPGMFGAAERAASRAGGITGCAFPSAAEATLLLTARGFSLPAVEPSDSGVRTTHSNLVCGITPRDTDLRPCSKPNKSSKP